MEDEEEISSPFWSQSSSHRRRSPSLFLNSGVLLFTLCITFSLFIFFLFPSLLSLRPNLFKKSWDSLNITLVLLALVFGFLSRNINRDDDQNDSNNNNSNNNNNRNEVIIKSNGSTPRGWYEYQDRTAVIGLRRSYSSYPDLREIRDADSDMWQFYDDTSLVSRSGDTWRSDDVVAIATRSDKASRVSLVLPVLDTGTVRIKEVKNSDDSGFVSRLNDSGRVLVTRKAINDMGDNGLDKKERIIDENGSNTTAVRRTAVVAPSEQSSGSEPFDGKIYESSSRKRGGNATKHFIDSFRKNKKKQRQKTLLGPHPPPSRKFFSSKKNKTKIAVTPLPPPPPPQFLTVLAQRSVPAAAALSAAAVSRSPAPVLQNSGGGVESPPPQFFTALAQRSVPAAAALTSAANSRSLVAPVQNGGGGVESPPPHFLTTSVPAAAAADSRYMSPVQNGGGKSPPPHQIPPPPPLPPFKMASWKFVVKGDYVRIGSMNSSGDEADFSPTSSESPTVGDERERGEERGMFCPSPDVNSKADMFIAKFRAGLKLQKMNSMNLKQGLGLSNLGPTTKT